MWIEAGERKMKRRNKDESNTGPYLSFWLEHHRILHSPHPGAEQNTCSWLLSKRTMHTHARTHARTHTHTHTHAHTLTHTHTISLYTFNSCSHPLKKPSSFPKCPSHLSPTAHPHLSQLEQNQIPSPTGLNQLLQHQEQIMVQGKWWAEGKQAAQHNTAHSLTPSNLLPASWPGTFTASWRSFQFGVQCQM